MDNEFTGDVELKINGKVHTIRFDWAALSTLKSKFTEAEIDKIIAGVDLTQLAELLIIGLARHHPDLDAKELYNNPPAFIPSLKAVEKSLTYAYWGADGPPVDDESADKDPVGKTEKKSKATKKK